MEKQEKPIKHLVLDTCAIIANPNLHVRKLSAIIHKHTIFRPLLRAIMLLLKF